MISEPKRIPILEFSNTKVSLRKWGRDQAVLMNYRTIIRMLGEPFPRPGCGVARHQEDPPGEVAAGPARVRPGRTPAPGRTRNGRDTTPDSRPALAVRPRERTPPTPVRPARPRGHVRPRLRGCSVATSPIREARRRRGRPPGAAPRDGTRSRKRRRRPRSGAAARPGPGDVPSRRRPSVRAGTGGGIPRGWRRRCRARLPPIGLRPHPRRGFPGAGRKSRGRVSRDARKGLAPRPSPPGAPGVPRPPPAPSRLRATARLHPQGISARAPASKFSPTPLQSIPPAACSRADSSSAASGGSTR